MKAASRRGKMLAAKAQEKSKGGPPRLSKFAAKHRPIADPDSPFAALSKLKEKPHG